MAKLDFSNINSAAAKSFNQQRNVIKKIGKGQTVLCEQCGDALLLDVASEDKSSVRCLKGCTNISLEVENAG